MSTSPTTTTDKARKRLAPDPDKASGLSEKKTNSKIRNERLGGRDASDLPLPVEVDKKRIYYLSLIHI